MNRWIEPLFAAAILLGIARALWFLYTEGYLPPPFFYEPSDVWMDWFNTAYWAHQPGAYDAWNTIYPPLSFVFLRLMTYAPCYLGAEGTLSRECDWYGAVTLHAFFVLNIILVSWAFYKFDRSTAVPRAIAVSAGMPMLYGLERGNLLLPCFTALLLAYGPLVKSARLRWLAAGLAVNFKVYLIAAIFPQLIKGRWRWFEGAMLATVLVYVATFLILGDGSPTAIIDNITNFQGNFQSTSFLELWYAFTYRALLSLLDGDVFPIVATIGSDQVELGLWLFPLMLRITQLSIVLAVAAAWMRPSVVPMHRLTFFGVAMALITAEPGGYAQVFVTYFVLQERWHGVGRKVAIIIAYLLSLPWEININPALSVIRDSFLVGHTVEVHYFITVGPFVRPGLIMLMVFALAMTTLREVIADWWQSDGSLIQLPSARIRTQRV